MTRYASLRVQSDLANTAPASACAAAASRERRRGSTREPYFQVKYKLSLQNNQLNQRRSHEPDVTIHNFEWFPIINYHKTISQRNCLS